MRNVQTIVDYSIMKFSWKCSCARDTQLAMLFLHFLSINLFQIFIEYKSNINNDNTFELQKDCILNHNSSTFALFLKFLCPFPLIAFILLQTSLTFDTHCTVDIIVIIS